MLVHLLDPDALAREHLADVDFARLIVAADCAFRCRALETLLVPVFAHSGVSTAIFVNSLAILGAGEIMKRREFIRSSVTGSVGAAMAGSSLGASSIEVGVQPGAPTRKILIAGGGFGTRFIRYVAELTGKARPKLLFLPTASFDNPTEIILWYRFCAPLAVEPSHQESNIDSESQTRTWEEVLLSVDGIVCSGGNTLNQQAIWKAHGIDAILKQAWDRGIVLAGASAGSLCWFEHGSSDSRPKELSKVDCLGFLQGSHSPHYDVNPARRPFYHRMILSGQMKPGYACDNRAGIYFEDNTVKRVVHATAGAKVYYVSVEGGKIVEKMMEPEMLA